MYKFMTIFILSRKGMEFESTNHIHLLLRSYACAVRQTGPLTLQNADGILIAVTYYPICLSDLLPNLSYSRNKRVAITITNV